MLLDLHAARDRLMVEAVATWRRTSDGEVHVLIEPALIARCGTPARELGEPLREVAFPICERCVSALLHDIDDTEAVLRSLADPRRQRSDNDHLLEVARGAMRSLLQTIPEGSTRTLLTQAESSLATNPAEAHKNIRQWRANMRAAGVLPTT